MNKDIIGQVRGGFASIIPLSSYYILFKGKYTADVNGAIKGLTFFALFFRTLTIYAITSSLLILLDVSWDVYEADQGLVLYERKELYGTVDIVAFSILLVLAFLITSLCFALSCNKKINKALKDDKVKSRGNLPYQLNIVKGLNLSIIPFSRLVFLIVNRKKMHEYIDLFPFATLAYASSLFFYGVFMFFFLSLIYEVHTSYFYSAIRIDWVRENPYMITLARLAVILAPIPLATVMGRDIRQPDDIQEV